MFSGMLKDIFREKQNEKQNANSDDDKEPPPIPPQTNEMFEMVNNTHTIDCSPPIPPQTPAMFEIINNEEHAPVIPPHTPAMFDQINSTSTDTTKSTTVDSIDLDSVFEGNGSSTQPYVNLQPLNILSCGSDNSPIPPRNIRRLCIPSNNSDASTGGLPYVSAEALPMNGHTSKHPTQYVNVPQSSHEKASTKSTSLMSRHAHSAPTLQRDVERDSIRRISTKQNPSYHTMGKLNVKQQ